VNLQFDNRLWLGAISGFDKEIIEEFWPNRQQNYSIVLLDAFLTG
jgi:hypothetical protein